METSDSEECFESADEDFSSDDEDEPSITIKEEIDTKKSKNKNKSTELNNNPSLNSKEIGPGNNNKKNVNKTKDVKTLDDNKTCIASKDNKSIETESKLQSDVVECLKSEVNCELKESNIKNSDLISIEEIARKETKTRPKYGVPPARVECWEPGMNYDVNKKKDDDLENSGLFIPEEDDKNEKKIEPEFPECRKTAIDSLIGEIKSKDIKEACITPAQLECWEPGYIETVTIANLSENSSCETEDVIKESEPSQETKIKSRIIKKDFVEPIIAQQDASKKEVITDSENMWADEEGWGWDEDKEKPEKPADTTDVVDDLWNNDDWGSNETKITDEKKKEEPDDLWGEEDDWQIEDKPEKDNSVGDIGKVFDNIKINETDNSWGGWGNWGLSSVLSTAANLTTTVSQSLTTAIGVPDPEDLARQHLAEREQSVQPTTQEVQNDQPTSFHLGNLVSGVSTITKLVETTGTKVISGGLDTLEILGKKTMQVLSENDPGLKKKRAFLKIDGDKPVLSQMLREAKAKADEENKERERQHFARKANYESIFDDHQGLVHLEALEMLSKQCDIKLENMLSKNTESSLTEMRETMDQVKELCELPEEDEEESSEDDEIKDKLDNAVSDLNVPITYKELLLIWEETIEWINALNDESNEKIIHQHGIETLARLTAVAVEQFHKTGELLLVKEHRSTADEADSLVQLTTILSGLIGSAASKFSEQLNVAASRSGNKEEINSLITNIFYEAANSSRYIQDAFQLLIPVLQVGAI